MITISDLTEYMCGDEMPIAELLDRLNRSKHLFQIVVDGSGKLLGTVTDGDIRRAMLHGIGLDHPARECMQTRPTTGSFGDADGNRTKLSHLGTSRPFLPVLDEAGVVREVLVSGGGVGIDWALVMAGGMGKRLGARTSDTPKPLLDVAGRPILDHVLEGLEDASVQNINIAVHYRAQQIKDFIAKRESRATINCIEEDEPLGTAGALGGLAGKITAPLLVVNGDVITDANVAALHEFHVRHELDATIGVARHDVDVPFGIVRYGEDGLFLGIDEKPRISNFIAAGIYYLAPEFVALVPKGRPIDMPELLGLGKSIGLKIGLFPIHEYWTDVGHPADLDAADERARLAGEGK